METYVRPYPGPGRKWQISIGGGREPVWAPDGRELFYRNLKGDQMMVVEMVTEPEFQPTRARLLFDGYYRADLQTYDIHPDGQRFLMIRYLEPPSGPIEIVPHWHEELKRLARTDN